MTRKEVWITERNSVAICLLSYYRNFIAQPNYRIAWTETDFYWNKSKVLSNIRWQLPKISERLRIL